jgi:hypothetical protein
MGMHRDGTRWNLPEDLIEERRKVFWEVQAADVFQAHCFSRPYEPHVHCQYTSSGPTGVPSTPSIVIPRILQNRTT